MKKTAPLELTLKQKRILVIIITCVYIIFCALVFVYVGKPFVTMLDEPGKFQDWIAQRGTLGPVIFFLMVALQVFVAVIPGEPFEIAAGYAFGGFWGTVICMAAIALGEVIVFCMIKKFGVRALELFVQPSKIDAMKNSRLASQPFGLMFLVFFIPGTPKDILTYFAGLTSMKLPQFIFMATIARFPSIVTSTVGGSALGNGNFKFAIIVFAVTAIVSIAGVIIYSRIKKSIETRKD